jgi:peroxiredoxin
VVWGRTRADAKAASKILADDLLGSPLPATAITNLDGNPRALSELTAGWLIVYCIPGFSVGGEDSRLEDARDHHAFVGCYEHLSQRKIALASLSSASTEILLNAVVAHKLTHYVMLDTRLVVADALGLPTVVAGDLRAYSRLTLVAKENVIEHVFYPVAHGGTSARQALTWIAMHEGDSDTLQTS